jgi:phosphoribosylglycinamide formyltransferase-1
MTGGQPGIVVLISGRGSNLQSILDETRAGRLPAEVRAVISNNPDAPGLAHARAAGVPDVVVVNHRDFPNRAAFERALMDRIDAHRPALVVLAGFMRVLGRDFIEHYAGRLMNIHPSLLPAFPGLNTHARAIEAGVRRHGATVHFVTPEVDAGPIIAQAEVAVLPGDTPEQLAERVLEQEHRLYPRAIRWFLEGRLTLRGRQVLLDGRESPEQGLAKDPPD